MKSYAAIARMSDAQLLEQSFGSLGLSIGTSGPMGSLLRARIQRLWAELEAKGLRFRPHVWLSTDFFSPDGVPGIALPFYLVHPRLMLLERLQNQGCEGQGEAEGMRLLRHEAGHAFDTAFGLHRRPEWRRLFGKRSAPYLRSYAADPASRDFVRYLPLWYAQSHPAEDFAESFAIWLDPACARLTQGLSPLGREKLAWIGEVLHSLRHTAPLVKIREQTEALHIGPRRTRTLAQHYFQRTRRTAREPDPSFAPWLKRAFSSTGNELQRSSAAAHLQAQLSDMRACLPLRWREDFYSQKQVHDAMLQHCRLEGLRLAPGAAGPSPALQASWVSRSLDALSAGTARLGR